MPGVNGLGVVAGGVQNAENAECTDCVTIASIAERWTGLKAVSCWDVRLRIGLQHLLDRGQEGSFRQGAVFLLVLEA